MRNSTGNRSSYARLVLSLHIKLSEHTIFLLFPLLIIGGREEQKVSSSRKKEDKKTPHNAALTMGQSASMAAINIKMPQALKRRTSRALHFALAL